MLKRSSALDNYNTKQVTTLQSQGDYLIITYKELPEIAVRTLILNRQEHVVFQSSDVIDKVSIDGNQMVYRVYNSPQLYYVSL